MWAAAIVSATTLFVACNGRWLHRRGRAPLDILFAPFLLGGGAAAGLLAMAARRYRRAHVFTPAARALIAAAPLEVAVTLEGRAASSHEGAMLVAPVGGGACIYYRVDVEAWEYSGEGAAWRLRDRRWKMVPFVIVDETGVAHLAPPVVADDDGDAQPTRHDPVDLEMAGPEHVETHTSETGASGLEERARAYVEVNKTRHKRVKKKERIRVTEVTLREGDVVTVLGNLEERCRAGVFRDSATRVRTLTGLPRVLPMSHDELCSLQRLHREVLAALHILLAIALLAGAHGIRLLVAATGNP